jgi:hypothetical protein
LVTMYDSSKFDMISGSQEALGELKETTFVAQFREKGGVEVVAVANVHHKGGGPQAKNAYDTEYNKAISKYKSGLASRGGTLITAGDTNRDPDPTDPLSQERKHPTHFVTADGKTPQLPSFSVVGGKAPIGAYDKIDVFSSIPGITVQQSGKHFEARGGAVAVETHSFTYNPATLDPGSKAKLITVPAVGVPAHAHAHAHAVPVSSAVVMTSWDAEEAKKVMLEIKALRGNPTKQQVEGFIKRVNAKPVPKFDEKGLSTITKKIIRQDGTEYEKDLFVLEKTTGGTKLQMPLPSPSDKTTFTLFLPGKDGEGLDVIRVKDGKVTEVISKGGGLDPANKAELEAFLPAKAAQVPASPRVAHVPPGAPFPPTPVTPAQQGGGRQERRASI